jgi:hypothetical protein
MALQLNLLRSIMPRIYLDQLNYRGLVGYA